MTLKTKTKNKLEQLKKIVTNDIEDTKIESRLDNFTNIKIMHIMAHKIKKKM
jgi:hypothetical protein